MGEVLSLPLLFDAIVAKAADDYAPDPPPVGFFFGWREPYLQITEAPATGANRIVCMPGDENGAGGEDKPPRNPGREPRPLATEEEIFTWFIWSVDTSDLTNERKQYTAARMLFDAWRRWIYLVSHTDGDTGIGPVTITRWHWNKSKVERGYGAEIIVSGSVSAMVPDEAPTLVTDVTAEVSVTLNDQVDEIVVVST